MKKQLMAVSLAFGLLLLNLHSTAQTSAQAIKVACVGNGITEGAGLDTTYPNILQALLGEQYVVRNYGIGGCTLLKSGDRPYWKEAKYQEVLEWSPDIVVILLGTDDTKPQNWQYKEAFLSDYVAFIKSFKKLSSKPKVFICNPIPVFEDRWGINGVIMKNEVLPAIKKASRRTNVKSFDLYAPFIGKSDLTYDGIHPNNNGAGFLATEIYKALKTANAVLIK